MEATIYIDVLFFWEWITTCFLLWTTGRIAGFSSKKWRLALGAFLSAFLHSIALLWGGIPRGVLFSVLLLTLSVSTAYLPKSPKNFLRLFFAAWVASFLLGGGIQMLFTMTSIQSIFGSGLSFGMHFLPWQTLLWGIIMGYLLIKAASKWIEAHIVRRREFCTVYLRRRGKWIEGRTLIDTGNGLRRKGKGVLVMSFPTVTPLFSEEEVREIIGGDYNCLIPMGYTSLGNPQGQLFGFFAEEGRFQFGEKTIRHDNLYVGISFELFTGAYEGLTPPCLLEEEEI